MVKVGKILVFLHDITPNSMHQKRNTSRRGKFGIRGSLFVSTVSIAMVLVVIGIVTFIGLVANRVSDDLRSGFEAVVIVDESAAAGAVDTLVQTLKSAAYVEALTYTSAEEVNKQWLSRLGDEELADLCPFQAEYSVKIKREWFSADSLQSVASQMKALPAVYEVKMPLNIAGSVDSTINTVMFVLTVIAAVLLLITIVLIYNTASMSIQARRVVIHTMQYVGARPSFICRPYMFSSALSGLIGGVVASIVLVGLLLWVRGVMPVVFDAVGWKSAVVVFLSLTAAGIAVGVIATMIAVNSYLRRRYEDVHR